MKCKVFAATIRSTQNMRQMTMEREVPSGDSHVVLDVKYCGVLYIINRVGVFLSLFFCISSLLALSRVLSGDDDQKLIDYQSTETRS